MGAFERIYQASHLSYKNKFLETIKSFTGGSGLRILVDIQRQQRNGANIMSSFNTEIHEVIESGKEDSKGRAIGYAVDIKEHSRKLGVFMAKVQKTRSGKNFGPSMLPNEFSSLEEAMQWAAPKAKAMAAKV